MLARIAANRGAADFLAALKSVPQWICWAYGPKQRNGKRSKPPVDPVTGKGVNAHDPANWMDFETALNHVRNNPRLAGIGFVSTPNLNITGLDIDDCRDPETGEHTDKAERILSAFRNTYAEVSPSGAGYRLFAFGTTPEGFGNHKGKTEAYSSGQYLTVTFDHVTGHANDLADCTDALHQYAREYLSPTAATPASTPTPVPSTRCSRLDDAEVLERATSNATTGGRFGRLWAGDWCNLASHSEADLALCRYLYYWSGDAEQVDRLYRMSALARPKWDRRCGGQTYGERTLERAAASLAGRCYGGLGPGQTKRNNTTCVVIECLTDQSDPDRLLQHIRMLRARHGRAVGLSARQAAKIINKSPATAARALAQLRASDRIVIVTAGTYETGHASEYDLPEHIRTEVSAPVPTPLPARSAARGHVPISVWSARLGGWQDCGSYSREHLAGAYDEISRKYRRAKYIAVGEQIIHQRGTGRKRTVRSWTASAASAN